MNLPPPTEVGTRRIDRRSLLLGGASAVGLAASAGLINVLGTPSLQQDPLKNRSRDLSNIDHQLVVSNWPLYIDTPTKGQRSTLQDFERRYGINVTYNEDINDNNVFFAKIKDQLGSGQPIGRDIIVLTNWMAARVVNLGWIQPLDPTKVPNLHKNLLPSLKVDWDPNRMYSAPWQSGLTGIAYNKKVLPGGVKSVKELLTRSDLNGRISVLSEMPDTMGLVLLAVGANPAKFTQAEWEQAIELITKARSDGQIRAFTGNEYINDLSAGNYAASLAWSGDIAASGDPNLVFVTPEEGLMIWADNMLVPNHSQHELNAEKWINYYYDPEIAARVSQSTLYICPVAGTQQVMEKLDPSLAHNPLIFPSEEMLKQTHAFMPLAEYQQRDYEGAFGNVMGS